MSAALDLDAMETRLRGGKLIWACDHPDVQDRPASDKYRGCVLDTNEPDQCEMSCSDNKTAVREKTACPMWREVQFVEPQPLTIEEGLALIGMVRGAPSSNLEKGS